MANRYWIGDSGNWNDTSHWSATSGGVGGAVVPTLSDDVFFNNLSFTGTSTVTVNVIANCLSMSWSGTTQNVTFTNSAYILNVYGSLTLWTGSTWNFSSTGYLYMKATDSRTITTNGISIKCNRLYFDSVSGTWLLQDDLYLDSSNTYLINGTLNTNNFDFYASGMFDASSGGVKTLLLGSSTLTCTRYRTSSANSIYNYGTSTVIVSSVGINGGLLGTNIFYNLILKNIDVPGIISLDSNQYVTNQLTIIGYNSGQKRLLISSNTLGTPRTITASDVIASNVDFRDISVPLNLVPNWNLSGITGGSGDCGGNLNITFTSGQTQYWYGGSGNWSDSINWFTQTSGVTQGRVPLPQDDAIFDENSFSGTSTVIADCRRIPTTNMINVNQSVIFTPSQLLECYGSFVVGNNITLWGSLDRFLVMYSRSSSYLSLLGKTIRMVGFNCLGLCTLLSDIVLYEYLAHAYGGKVDFNDFNVTTPKIANNGGSGSSMWLGNGTITMVGNTIIDVNIFENPTFLYSEGSTIKLTTPSNSFTQIFSGGNNSYNKLWLSGTHLGYYNITENNTFSELKIDAGRKVRFTAGTTTTVGTLLAEGTSTSGITISSVTTSPHTLVKSGTGTVTVNYCTISYSTASTSFRARNSVNGGSNTGWDFTPTNRYWVGNTGNWDDPEHWSSTSGGVGADLLGADLYSGWNFTSGWLVNGAATINDLNTFTTTASAGLYRSAVLLTPDSWYKVTATGSTSSNGFSILQGINAGTRIQLYDFGIGAFYGTFYFKASSSTELYLYLRNTSVGVTDITTLTLQLVSTVPSTLSDAYFDANSFSTGSTVTINANVNCFDMTWTGLDQNVTLLNSAFNLNVYGSLTLWIGLTWTFTSTGYLYLKATDPQYITTNGIRLTNYVYFDSIGSWTNLDNMNFNNIYLVNGNWNTNSKTIYGGDVLATQSGTKTATFGSSQISCIRFQMGYSSTNFTVNADTSTITCVYSNLFGGKIWNNVVINEASFGYANINDNNNTFNNLTLNGYTGTTSVFGLSGNQIINNLIINGCNSTNYRTIIVSNTIGTQLSITANAVIETNCDYRDIKMLGGCLSGGTLSLPFDGLRGDAGGNSGITFTSGQTQYFKHTSGAVNWSDSTKWFTSSGGLVQGRVPLPQDDAIFDENSFSGTSVVTIDVRRIGRSLDMGYVNTGITISCLNEIDTYGSVLMNSNILFNANTYNWNFNGDGNFDLKQNGCDFAGMAVQINRGTYTLKSDMTAYRRSFFINGGTFDYNDYNFIGFSLAMNGTPNVYLGNGTLEILRTDSGGWLPSINMNLYSENSTIKLNPSSGTGNFTIGNSKIYNKFWFSGNHTGNFDISGNNTFTEMKIDAGRKVRFTAGTSQTISRLIALGKPSNLITLSSVTPASTYTLTGPQNDWLVDYCSIQDSITPPTKYAGVNSVNISNNTGWNFAISKIRYWVGNSGTSTDTSHWSLQANGVSGASVPTSSESVVFDRFSFTLTGQTVTLSGDTNLAYLHMDDVPSGLTLSSTYDLNVYNSIYLASGMTFNVNNLYFKSPYTGNVINTNNTILNTNEIYFDNLTGIWTNGDNFTTTANIHHINGTWSVNRIVTIENYLLGLGTKNILLDNSIFNVNNFDIKINSTNFTITPSISKIIATSGVTMLSQTLYDVQTNSFDAVSPTVHNLILSGDTWVVVGSPTITGTLQIDGNSSTDRFLLKSDTLKTQRTVTAQNTMMSNVDIIDIKGNDWNLSGTSIGDGGGNTGITFTPATTQYWNQGSGDWSDVSKWTSRVPLLQDTAVFDENSFTGTSTLNLDMPRISSINMSGVTQQVILNDMNVYGDINLNDYIKISNLYLYGRNNYLNLSGDTNVFINGNYINQSNFKSNSLTLLDGIFSLGDYILEVNSWNVSGITIPDNSVIKFNSTGSTNFTFNGGNNNYYNLWLSGSHTGYYDILGNNTFNNIKIEDGRKVRFESNSTQTINTLSAQSISGITITSTSNSQHTLIFNQYDPFLVFNYLDLSYSKVLPLDRIYAVSSINSGNNTGWLFTNSPLFVWIQSNWGILVDENGKFLW